MANYLIFIAFAKFGVLKNLLQVPRVLTFLLISQLLSIFILLNSHVGFILNYSLASFSPYIIVFLSIVLLFDQLLEKKVRVSSYMLLPSMLIFEDILYYSMCVAAYVLIFRKTSNFNSFKVVALVLMSILSTFISTAFFNILLLAFVYVSIIFEVARVCRSKEYSSESLLLINGLIILFVSVREITAMPEMYIILMILSILLISIFVLNELKSTVFVLITTLTFLVMNYGIPFKDFVLIYAVLVSLFMTEKRVSRFNDYFNKISFQKIRAGLIIGTLLLSLYGINIDMISSLGIVFCVIFFSIQLLCENSSLKKVYVSDEILLGLLPVLGILCLI